MIYFWNVSGWVVGKGSLIQVCEHTYGPENLIQMCIWDLTTQIHFPNELQCILQTIHTVPLDI